jgi:hypothetical protein
MADIIVKNTEGTKIATIEADSINSTFETALVGENVEDYMVEINNNFVKLLENFAGESEPPKASQVGGAVEGQIWYDKTNDKVNYKTGSEWTSNTDALGGKGLDGVREYVLSGLDTTGKLSKAGGTVTGEINVNGAVQVRKSVVPNTSEGSSLGGQNNRFRNVYLKEDGIRLGDQSKGLTFKPHNFVYAVDSDDDRVDSFPTGAIILHQETGEAIIKKSTGKFTKNNRTFRKLADDKQNSAVIGGNKFRFLGDVGLIAGGWGSLGSYRNASIEKITISTPGNGTSFGNLTYGRSHMGCGMSSGTRGVFQGGWNWSHGKHNGKMDYVTFATPGNATYFGTFGHENYGSSSVSDGTRGVIGSGYNHRGGGPRGHHYIARYITIETPGNAAKFGTIKAGYWGTAVSSGTRGVFGGYSRRGWSSRLHYITIQTPRNSIYFGNTRRHRGPAGSATTDTIKGLYFGGWDGNWHNNFIEYITIATPSNGIDFGRIRNHWNSAGIGLSNGVRGIHAARWWNNDMEYVTIQTPMNSIDFGNMTMRRGSRPSGASGN